MLHPPILGKDAQVHKVFLPRVPREDWRMAKSAKPPVVVAAISKLFSANLKRLMSADKSLDSQPKLGEATGIDPTSIGRMQRGENNPRLDHVASIAKAFKLQAWQVIYPNLVPGRPPQNLPEMSNKAIDIALRYDSLKDDPVQQKRAYAVIKNALDMAVTPPATPPDVPIGEPATSQ